MRANSRVQDRLSGQVDRSSVSEKVSGQQVDSWSGDASGRQGDWPMQAIFYRILLIIYKKMFAGSVKVVFPALNRVLLFFFFGKIAPVFKIPGSHKCRGIVLAVLNVPSALQHERGQSFLCQFLGGPAAGNAGAYDYRIELVILCHWLSDLHAITDHYPVFRRQRA